MNTKTDTDKTDIKALLSTLWVFVLLNVIFRDIHEFFRPGLLQEIMAGTVKGVEITEEMMLLAGLVLELAILMVILSRVLPYRLNRPANMVVGALMIVSVFANGTNDLDDIFFAAAEIAALAVIIWLAWRWRRWVNPTTPATHPASRPKVPPSQPSPWPRPQ